MIPVSIQDISKRFDSFTALDRVSLRVEPGELYFLLGPSGCGKTTLLRCIAGFITPDAGRISLGDVDVTRQPPHLRNTAMVFQNYALWPHRTVAGNVAFGLEERAVPKAERNRRVIETLASVKMEAYAIRKINQLSGGQQQRVALARALVVRPSCLLLDEPLSNLDAKLRVELRSEIRRVCHAHGVTSIYVTHDQKEALSVADRIAILDKGRVLQVGAPADIYRFPRTRFVADFIGETNLLPGSVLSSSATRATVSTAIGPVEGILPPGAPACSPGASVHVSIRPESWKLQPSAAPANSFKGAIAETVYLGEMAEHTFLSAAVPLKMYELNPRFAAPVRGEQLHAVVDPGDVIILAE